MKYLHLEMLGEAEGQDRVLFTFVRMYIGKMIVDVIGFDQDSGET